MELQHRIGQLMVIGLPGTEVDDATRDLLETIQPGGVLLNGKNIESAQQVSRLIASVRELLQVPPIVAVDQEGGRVDRMKSILSATPSADLLRASNEASIAARMGETTADALRTLGFNVNFAPVLDIAYDDAAENGLKGRYLGSTPAEIVRLSGAYLEGLQHNGIVGFGKHFPGLGAARTDSHTELPEIDLSKELLLRDDLLPYLELFSKINARLNALIVGHGHYPAFDGPSALPASLSKNIIGSLLREELSFRGLVITDDLEMGAITSTRTVPDAAIAAIEAGADMVMVAGTEENARAAWNGMIQAARDNRITSKRISNCFDHIARVKSMVSPPLQMSEGAISRLRERIAELNLLLQA